METCRIQTAGTLALDDDFAVQCEQFESRKTEMLCVSGAAALACSRLQSPPLKTDLRSVLPVRGEARSAFSVKMGNAARFTDCLLQPNVDNFQFVSILFGPHILTAHAHVIDVGSAIW